MAGQKVACPTCGSQTVLRSLEPPRIKIPVHRLPTASHREEGKAGIAPVSRKILDNVEKVVIGKRQEVVLALVAFFSEGHLLLEDVPGVAKTMLARAISQSVGCSFKRIQCTPDLLPNDITGASVFNPKTTEFEFRRGPLFAHIVLADEINRTTPRTQSALLEAMSERQVTVDGTIYPLQRGALAPGGVRCGPHGGNRLGRGTRRGDSAPSVARRLWTRIFTPFWRSHRPASLPPSGFALKACGRRNSAASCEMLSSSAWQTWPKARCSRCRRIESAFAACQLPDPGLSLTATAA